MKHTKGEWVVRNNIGKKSEIGVIADNAPYIIAIMGNSKERPEEAEANARLIAAAPDLLFACKYAIEQLGNVKGLGNVKQLILPISNAIAKTEGK